MSGVSPQPPLVCIIDIHRTNVPVRSQHTSYRWRWREMRERETIESMGNIIRRPWLIKANF